MQKSFRLILALSLFVAGCAADSAGTVSGGHGGGAMTAAEQWCVGKGYARYSPAFNRCVATRPDIAARERNERLDTLNIINHNRSVQRQTGPVSYPVY